MTLRQTLTTLTRPDAQPKAKLPATVAGGFGTVAAAPINTTADATAARPLNARQAEALMHAELLSAVRSLVESSTEIASRLGRRGAINGVIDVRGLTFPAGVPSILTASYEVAAGSIVVENFSVAGVVIVQSGGAAGDTGPQTAGVGVQYVGPGRRLIMPLGDRTWTMSGTAGDKVNVQAFTGLQPFGVSAL
jgi:hypothetical protein